VLTAIIASVASCSHVWCELASSGWGKHKICVHCHSKGVCHDNCPFSNSQTDMSELVHTKYCKFIKKTKKDYQQQNMTVDSEDDDTTPANANKKAKADGNESN